MSPACAVPCPLTNTFLVLVTGLAVAQGLGKLGFIRSTSLVSSFLCKIPPARRRKSDLPVKFHAEGCKDRRDKTPIETRKREIRTSIRLKPFLLHIELNIGPSRYVYSYCGC